MFAFVRSACFCIAKKIILFPVAAHEVQAVNGEAVVLLPQLSEKQRYRALVVDDNHHAAESFARVLATMGCAATFVTNPLVAIDAAQALEARVVFLDLVMPELDGYQLARVFRAQYGEDIRLGAVTAYGDRAHREKSREAGFDAHVEKPVDFALVESMLIALFKT